MDVDGTCKLCHAPVKRYETENGKVMQVNPQHDPTGNVVLLPVAFGQPVAKVLGKDAEREGLVLWMPHAATCRVIRARAGRGKYSRPHAPRRR